MNNSRGVGLPWVGGARCAEEMECHFLASTELDEKLKRHPDILKEFFHIEAPATPAFLLEDYLVQEAELERFQSSFVPPDKDLVTQAQQILSEHRLLIIKGPMGIGKRSLALHLASTIVPDQAPKIIRTRRFTLVSELMRVTDSVILMPDFLGLFRFERTEVEDEIPGIDRLCRNNFVILTTSDAVLEEAMAETRLEDWDLLRECQVTLDEEAYGEAVWQKIWDYARQHEAIPDCVPCREVYLENAQEHGDNTAQYVTEAQLAYAFYRMEKLAENLELSLIHISEPTRPY